MTNILTKLVGDKREWKAMEARAEALPRDYRVVYGAIKKYLWRFTTGDGADTIAILRDVLATFEAEAARGVPVLEVTGADVAAFCDDRLDGASPYTAYLDRWRAALNESVEEQL
jgi:DNA-binding ferritin-like protein (Dps family)